MTTHYYVYYRVAAGGEASLRQAVMRMQAMLRAETGVSGRLLQRRDDPHTWMEIYETVSDAERFETALAVAVAREGLDALLPAGRTLERFVDPVEPDRHA